MSWCFLDLFSTPRSILYLFPQPPSWFVFDPRVDVCLHILNAQVDVIVFISSTPSCYLVIFLNPRVNIIVLTFFKPRVVNITSLFSRPLSRWCYFKYLPTTRVDVILFLCFFIPLVDLLSWFVLDPRVDIIFIFSPPSWYIVIPGELSTSFSFHVDHHYLMHPSFHTGSYTILYPS